VGNYTSPDIVVTEILRALSSKDSGLAASFAHPRFLDDFKRRQVFALTAQSGGNPTIGKRDLGAKNVSEARSLLRGSLSHVFGVESLAELEALSVLDIFTRILAAKIWGAPLMSTWGRLVGVVHARDDEAHAVIDTRPENHNRELHMLPYHHVRVMTLWKEDGSWSSLFNGGLPIDLSHGIQLGDYSSSQYQWAGGETHG
jgi:hypothetical protein